jgi:acyl-CoA synthetase (AMP-forming)/AMP-acid ligase II
VDIVASGGSTLTAEDYHSITERFGVELLHGYGLTEFTPVSRNIRETARPGTVGPPGEGVECRIVEASLESGVGEIAVRAPSMTHGYFREPDPTADAFRDGWFLTGDYGRFDDGHLVFVSEKKRTCKVNGTMVDLSEIERAVESIFPETEAHAQLSYQGLALRVGGPGARAEAERRGMSLERSVKSALKGVMAAHKIPKIVYEDAAGA